MTVFGFMDRLPQGAGDVLAVAALAAALLQCFLGYKLLRLWVTLAGGVIGLAAGLAIGTLGLRSEAAAAVLALALMLLFGFLAFRVCKLGVFLLCGLAAYSFVMGLLLAAAGPEAVWWMNVISLAAGLAAGLLGVSFLRTAVILTTAILSGLQAGGGIMALAQVPSAGPALVLGIILAVLGAAVQFATTKDKA